MAVGVPLSGISGNLGAACLCMALETEKEMVILHKLFLSHFMKSGNLPPCLWNGATHIPSLPPHLILSGMLSLRKPTAALLKPWGHF